MELEDSSLLSQNRSESPDLNTDPADTFATYSSQYQFLAYFPHYKKMKVGLCDLHGVCEPPPPINLWMPEPIFMKLGMYITAPEPISTAYFINPSHQSVCLFVYSSHRC
jgi:hypothetical protein